MPEKTVKHNKRIILLRSKVASFCLCLALLLCLLQIPVSAAEQSYALSGTYRFNDVLAFPSSADEMYGVPLSYTVNCFLSNMDLDYIAYCSAFSITSAGIYYYCDRSSSDVVNSVLPDYIMVNDRGDLGDGLWLTDSYGPNIQTITFTSEQEVSADFYAWFKSNAVRISDEEVAEDKGNKFVDQVLDNLPDPSQGVLAALKGLTDATAYTGTDAVLPIPAIVLPGIDGLFPETEIWGGTDFDFGEYIGMLPPTLLTLVQALFTIAIVLYCVYELKGIISYCLTLRESKGG